MKIKILSIFEFDDYAKTHSLRSFQQSSSFAIFMAEKGYDYDLVGFVDEENNIKAASLIVFKSIGKINKYGYAPKGFLIDYNDVNLLKDFTEKLKKYYKRKNVAFIKINPEIAIGEIDNKTYYVMYNNNATLESTLEKIGYKKLPNNLRFESLQPRFEAVIPLKEYRFKDFSKPTRNKIRKNYRKGLSIQKVERDEIDILYKFIKNKKNKTLNYYKNYYNVFAKNNNADVFLVKINFEQSLLYSQEEYKKEEERNEILSEIVRKNPTEENIAVKMQSDKTLLTFKNDIITATHELSSNKEEFIAGAITIKYQNRVSILISGYDKRYKRFSPNYFLHYQLCEYYKNNYDYLDLNGITGDFKKDNPYYGLNKFKLGFNPQAFEFIGEFDLIINKGAYKLLDRNGLLMKEFNRKQKGAR